MNSLKLFKILIARAKNQIVTYFSIGSFPRISLIHPFLRAIRKRSSFDELSKSRAPNGYSPL